MAQLAIVTDLDRCTGCHACTVACAQENRLKPGAFWTHVHEVGPSGKFPGLQMYFLPLACQHCRQPACVRVCPTGASHKRPDGIVLIDRAKCIGCQACQKACPYGNSLLRRRPEENAEMHSLRPLGRSRRQASLREDLYNRSACLRGHGRSEQRCYQNCPRGQVGCLPADAGSGNETLCCIHSPQAALGRTDVTIGIAKSVAASRARQTARIAVETPLISLGARLKGAHL